MKHQKNNDVVHWTIPSGIRNDFLPLQNPNQFYLFSCLFQCFEQVRPSGSCEQIPRNCHSIASLKPLHVLRSTGRRVNGHTITSKPHQTLNATNPPLSDRSPAGQKENCLPLPFIFKRMTLAMPRAPLLAASGGFHSSSAPEAGSLAGAWAPAPFHMLGATQKAQPKTGL